MRKTYIYNVCVAMLCTALLALSSCTSEVGSISEDGTSKGMMQVNLSLFTADYAQDTRTTGSVKGVEGIEDGNMQLLCFDKAGFFLGMGQNVKIDPHADKDGHKHSLTAQVYNSTARIHFLANAHITMNPQWAGMGENALMSQLVSKYDEHEHMVYWGCKKMNTPQDMAEYLKGGSHTIYMMRDRARVTTSFEGNVSGITGIEVALSGGADRGCMAPLDRSTLSYPMFEDEKSWQTSLNYVTMPTKYEHLGITEADFAQEAFAYETPNDAGDTLSVILKVTYNNGTVKYHKIFLQNDEYENYKVQRNHTYRINVQKLNTEYGYDTPQEAVDGVSSNDIWASVEDIVSDISSGDYSLKIGDGTAGATSIVYTGEKGGKRDISFVYTGAGMKENDFTCERVEDDGLLIDGTLNLSYAGSGNESKISFEINPISENLNTALIKLRDKKHGLTRNIKLYSISHFSFEPFDTGISIDKEAGRETDFSFTIPANYPKDLFPVTVMLASNDLNPRDMDVEVGSTNEPPINEEWNCWFTKKYYEPGKKTVTMRNVRTASGSQGKIYMKAKFFGKDANTVGQAIEIPVTFK